MYKIIHLGYAHPIDDARIFRKECTSLAKKDEFDVTYVTSNKSGDECGEFVKNNVKCIVLPLEDKKYVRLISYIKLLKNYLKREKEISVVHIHEPWLLPVARKLLKRNVKVIFDSHEFYVQQFKSRKTLKSKIISFLYGKYEKHICKKIAGVIVPCTYDNKNYFESFSKKTIIINNYVILDDSQAEAVKPHSVIKNPVLCYAGTISESRGITALIKGTYKANAKLILAGPFASEDYRTKLESMEEYNCVEYRGICNSAEIKQIYRESNIGTATLLNIGQYYHIDNMSTKVFECMESCLPIIICDSPYVLDVMKTYAFGIPVNSSDDEEIKKAILYLKANPEEATKMGDIGKEAVLEKYNWNIEEKKLFDFYKELL